MKRKIIQIAAHASADDLWVYALANDGTVWYRQNAEGWKQEPALPEGEPYEGTCGSCVFWKSHIKNHSGDAANFGVCKNPHGEPSRGNGRANVNDDETCAYGDARPDNDDD